MKTCKCNICKQLLPFEMFSKNKSKLQGINSTCKKCDKKQSLRYYYANRENVLPRMHKYYRDNKQKCRVVQKAYYLKHRPEYLERNRQERIKYPLKIQSRHELNHAIEGGELKRGRCEDCGKTPDQEKIYGHHEDYNKPLDIVWLCSSCHMRRHLSLSPV